MIRRTLRWPIAVTVGIGGFALAWWAAEVWLKLDRPTAVSLAAVMGPLLAAPLAWYAGRESTDGDQEAEPFEQPLPEAGGPRPRPRHRQPSQWLSNIKRRWVVIPAAAVAVVIAVAVGYKTFSATPSRAVADQAGLTVSPTPADSRAAASAAPASTAPSTSSTAKPCTAKPTTIAGQTRAATISGRGAKVAVNHTGKQVAISTQDQTVVLYEVSQLGCPTRAAMVPAPANAGRLSFSPNRNLLAVSGYIGGRGTVSLYDTTSLSSPRKAGSFEGGNSAFSANGKLMAFGAAGNTTVLVDVSNPASPARGATVGGSGTVVFSPARDLLATTDIGGSGHGTAVNLYSIASPAGPTKLSTIAHSEQPFAVAFSSTANLLAIATWQKTVTLWDIANPAAPALVATLTGYAEMVTDLVFSPTRATLATISIGTLSLWGVSNPAGPSRIAQVPDSGSGLAFQPQGGFLVSSGENTHLYTFG